MDFLGNGTWNTYARIEVPAGGYAPHVFPEGFSAHWFRLSADTACKASAQLHYT